MSGTDAKSLWQGWHNARLRNCLHATIRGKAMAIIPPGCNPRYTQSVKAEVSWVSGLRWGEASSTLAASDG
jgi:hypothetical protein